MNIARPTWCRVVISIVLWLSCFLIVIASNSRTLQKIEVLSFESTDEVRLVFDKKYLQEPIINFESGYLRLYWDSVKKDSRMPSNIASIVNPLIKGIRAIEVPGKNFVHLDIQLNSDLTSY